MQGIVDVCTRFDAGQAFIRRPLTDDSDGMGMPGGYTQDGADIRIIQLMLGHASIQQTQRYLNVTDEELRRGLEVSWKNQGRPLRLASSGN